jgi:hypothetical protein
MWRNIGPFRLAGFWTWKKLFIVKFFFEVAHQKLTMRFH